MTRTAALALAAAVAAAVTPAAVLAAGPAPRVVTICSDPWMPYAGEAGPGADEGYVIALARAALEQRGYQVRLGRPAGHPLREAGVVGAEVPIYLAFSKRTPDGAALAKAFDAGLRALSAQGKLAPLLARYGVPMWRRPGARRP